MLTNFQNSFLTFLIASAFLIGSFAYAETSGGGQFDSMKGRTQLDLSGAGSYSKDYGSSWYVNSNALYYFTSQFGFGGNLELYGGSNSSAQGLYFGIGPMVEYFIPVGERGHVFAQGLATVAGAERTTTQFNLGARVGYRYFVSEDIAFSAKLAQNWARGNYSGAQTTAGSLNLLLGFSLFF
jgi:hypothetical protein